MRTRERVVRDQSYAPVIVSTRDTNRRRRNPANDPPPRLPLALAKVPAPILRVPCPNPTFWSEATSAVIRAMPEAMRAWNGVGLAAPQVGWCAGVFVADARAPEIVSVLRTVGSLMRSLEPREHDGDRARLVFGGALVLLNPVVLEQSGDQVLADEACLSIPHVTRPISHRPTSMTLWTETLDGGSLVVRVRRLLAAICRHEMDHLEGRLVTDERGNGA